MNADFIDMIFDREREHHPMEAQMFFNVGFEATSTMLNRSLMNTNLLGWVFWHLCILVVEGRRALFWMNSSRGFKALEAFWKCVLI